MDIDEEPSETTNHRPPFLPFPLRAPRIEDAIETLPENHGTLSIDDDDDDNDDFPSLRSSLRAGLSGQNEGLFSHDTSHDPRLIPSAPRISDLPDYGIEEEMIRAAIEASKHDAEIGQPDDVLQQESEAGPSETRASKLSAIEEVGASASSNGRLGVEDGTEDTDEQEQPLEQQNINNHVDSWGACHLKNMMKRLCLRLQCLVEFLNALDTVYDMHDIVTCIMVSVEVLGLILYRRHALHLPPSLLNG